jgi:pimeloyl-ACP methyl ester carboxylesterase
LIAEPRIVDGLAVRDWGGSGSPIVFWHGLGPCASGAELVEVAPRLVTGGYHAYSVDAPGYGASPVARDYKLRALAEQLHGAVQALGLERPVVMGHSWGGAVVLAYAAAHPVRAVVLVDSGHIDYADVAEAVNAPDPVQMRWESREAFDDWLRENLDRATPEVLAGYRAGVSDADGEVLGTPAETARTARSGLLDRVSEFWPALADTPVLLFLATQEPHLTQNREYIARFETAVPHADVRWVDGASHGLIADVGPELGDQIADWLDRRLSA